MMKKYIIFPISLILLTSCLNNKDIFSSKEYGDFIYTTKKCEKGKTDIIGLSENGQKSDILIFPEIINDLCVRRLGANIGIKTSETINIANAKKVYFPSNYLSSASGISFTGNNDVTIYSPDGDMFNTIYYAAKSNTNAKIVASKESINHLMKNNKDISIMEEANVFYYSDERICYLDKVCGKISTIMPSPYNDNKKFVGWYQNKECTIEFDFDSFDVKETSNVFLYAKWLEE